MKKSIQVLLCALLSILAGLGWWQRQHILAWYAVRQLRSADESHRQRCVERVCSVGAIALPRVLSILESEDANACANAQAALTCWLQDWGPANATTPALLEQLSDRFEGFSAAGRRCVLQLHRTLAEQGNWPAVTPLCRSLARASLRDESAEVRLAAVLLAQQPGLDLFPQILPLMSDSAADVRSAALAAVAGVQAPDRSGLADYLLATDDLIRWLHDPDTDVRRLCETALRGRGLSEEQVELGRLITHDKAQVRVQVLNRLLSQRTVEAGAWLDRLGHDEVAAVRAAAIRALAESRGPIADEQLLHVLQNDPAPTVRQIARDYLEHARTHSRPAGSRRLP